MNKKNGSTNGPKGDKTWQAQFARLVAKAKKVLGDEAKVISRTPGRHGHRFSWYAVTPSAEVYLGSVLEDGFGKLQRVDKRKKELSLRVLNAIRVSL